jgi:hypothetical protein
VAPTSPSPRALRGVLAAGLLVLSACSRDATATTAVPSPAVTDSASACAGVPPETGTPLVRTGSDGCTDLAAVLSRCAPRLAPVLTFLGSQDRRYLGGRFAVAVRDIPPDATSLGRAGDLEVYREPGLRGRVFVAGASGISRWLELPGPGRVAPATVSVIGDSIALGSAQEIVDALPEWSTTIDAEIGRPTDAGVPIAATVATASPSAVVVELGTNDENADTFVASARTILRSLKDEPLVVWISPHAPFEVTTEVRAAIDRLVAHTSNAVVADWDAAVPPDALSSDDVHLLPDRVDVFADFVARDLRTWRMAVTGSGATACAPVA